VELRKRYDYFKFIKLVSHSDFVVSDGGSNQEECFYLGKPILLLRKATERTEGIGKNCMLSEYNFDKINYFIKNYNKFSFPVVSGDTSPSDIITKFILENYP
jgi:UDP-N-acetylglucosamine 2-epimerase (non-hydrolysing)